MAIFKLVKTILKEVYIGYLNCEFPFFLNLNCDILVDIGICFSFNYSMVLGIFPV